MNVTSKVRQRVLLLHYASAATNEMFDKLPDSTPGDCEDLFEKTVQALTNYFTSRRNREYEIYVFSVKLSKSENNETISAFHTWPRQLAVTCELDDVDLGIKTQIIQSCSSHKLRTKALETRRIL